MLTKFDATRYIAVLLAVILFLLTACDQSGKQPQTGQLTSSDTTGPAVTEAVTDTENTGETTAETEAAELTAVRMRTEYETIDITARYAADGLTFDLSTSVVSGGTLYIKSAVIPDGIQAHAYYYGLDSDGNLTGTTLTVPLPRISDAKILMWDLLEDGRFVIGYEDTEKIKFNKRDRYLAIMEQDGTVTESLYIGNHLEFQHLSVFEKTTQYGDHKVYIFAGVQNGYLRCFDERLNERVCGISRDAPLSGVLDNEWFSIGNVAAGRQRIHLTTGEIKDAPLRVPEEYGFGIIRYGADGELYLIDQNGVFHYRDEGRLVSVLNYIDSGCQYQVNNDKIFRIINQNAIYLLDRNSNKNSLTLYRMTHVLDDTPAQTIRITSLTTANDGKRWLTNAISEFNRLYPEYHAELTFADPVYDDLYTVNEACARYLDEMLLYGDHPDLLINAFDPQITMPHYDKGIFLDLYTVLDQPLLESVENALGYQEKLYQVPLMMQLDTFAASRAISDGALTYEAFFRALESLQEGQVLTDDLNRSLYENALMDFLDMNTKTANYDSDGFRNVLRYLYPIRMGEDAYTDQRAGGLSFGSMLTSDGWFGAQDTYWTRNGTVGAALASGDMKFLSVNFRTLDAYSIIRLLFGDTSFSLCGYPSMGVGGARMSALWSTSVFYDTDVPDGCAKLLNFLLSDEKQCDLQLLSEALPVTSSGTMKAIEQYRFTYFFNTTVKTVFAHNTPGYVNLTPAGTSATYQSSFGETKHTEDMYTVFEMSDAEANQLYDFLNGCSIHASTDTVVKSIIEEEASFWEGNARSLEETTKIIDSRVWIYLNE